MKMVGMLWWRFKMFSQAEVKDLENLGQQKYVGNIFYPEKK